MLVTEQKSRHRSRFVVDVIITAMILIAVGILFVGRNLGYIDQEVFRIFISWQMLLIVLGIWSLFHKGYYWGTIISAVGVFFLIPHITGAGQAWISTYWPVIFIFAGIIILMSLIIPKKKMKKNVSYSVDDNYTTEDGFVVSENSFGNLRKIVIDEVFKGAKIKNSFGGIELDLRRSDLEPGDTYIDLESSFGGVEIKVPENWVVIADLDPSFAGVHDKRQYHTANSYSDSRLIIQGKVNFGGVEIKS